MPTAISVKSHPVATYAELRRRVKETLILGQQRIEREKVRTYWETGRQINEYLEVRLKPGQNHAEHGERVLLRLSADLGIGTKVLYRCMRFAEAFPNFSGRRNKALTWTHYRTLIAIPDERKRLALAERAERLEWNSTQLEKAVKEVREKDEAFEAGELEEALPPPRKERKDLLAPKRGTLYLYTLIRPKAMPAEEAGLFVDLGFAVYKKTKAYRKTGGLEEGMIVESKPYRDSYELARPRGKTAADLYTYRGYVEAVVDGDTLRVHIDLGLDTWTRQYLRLRGIDCPELDTQKGKLAQAFVKRELAGSPWITLQSSKSDRWDRYLADVFYTAAGEERFLNNRLLEARLAERITL
jgi:hypothetical protein